MKGKSLATEELKIVIPFPSFVTSTDLKVDHGKCTYDEHTKVCVWDVGTIGSESPKLTGTMKVREVPEGTVRLERLPMTVHFRVPKATVSGLEVANMFLGE